MNPYVYKKHHQPYQLLVVVSLFIMILIQPVNSECNFAIKKIQIYSDMAKGYLQINGTKLLAQNHNYIAENHYFYKVTIDRHYMLLYHIKSEKFICWNNKYKRIIARKNPVNLAHCKFEDRPSMLKGSSQIRFTTQDDADREIEIRFTKNGQLATPRRVRNCLSKLKRQRNVEYDVTDLLNLDLTEVKRGRPKQQYISLTKCASPDCIIVDLGECESGVPDFCKKMNDLRKRGRSISPEITDLCKKQWGEV